MRTKVLLVLITGMLLLLNCQRHDQNAAKEGASSTIVFKHFKLANAAEQFKSSIKSFEKQHPGITVREEILPSNTNIQHQFYATSLQAGSSDFDVFLIDVIWTPEFSLAGWLEDLSDLLPQADRSAFLNAPIQADTYNGRLYAIPWYVDGGVLYYRRDLLDKYGFQPPKTFDELAAQAQAVLAGEARSDLYGFLWQGKQYEGLICAANEIIGGFGGAILGADNKLHLLDKETQQALQWLKDTIYRYKISPEWILTADEENTRLSFLNGNCIFLRNWPYCWTFFQTESSPVKGKIGVSAMPSVDGRQGVSTLGGWQIAVNRFSKKKELSKKFVKFMTSSSTQLAFALKVGTKPSRKALYSNVRLKSEQPFISDLYHILESTRARPQTPFYPQISQILQVEFSAILADIRSVEKAMHSATLQIEHILELEKMALSR